MLGDVGQEGDRLVMHLALDLANALDLEFAALAQCLRRAGRDYAELFLRLAGIGLDVELDAEIVLRLPDRRHLRPAIAWDHAETSSAEISLFGAQDAAAAESTMKDTPSARRHGTRHDTLWHGARCRIRQSRGLRRAAAPAGCRR